MPRILLFGQRKRQIFLKYPQRQKATQKRTVHLYLLRSKRFRLFSEQSQPRFKGKALGTRLEQGKTEKWDFWFWPREKWNESFFSRGLVPKPHGNSLLLRRLGFRKVEANDWR